MKNPVPKLLLILLIMLFAYIALGSNPALARGGHGGGHGGGGHSSGHGGESHGALSHSSSKGAVQSHSGEGDEYSYAGGEHLSSESMSRGSGHSSGYDNDSGAHKDLAFSIIFIIFLLLFWATKSLAQPMIITRRSRNIICLNEAAQSRALTQIDHSTAQTLPELQDQSIAPPEPYYDTKTLFKRSVARSSTIIFWVIAWFLIAVLVQYGFLSNT